MTAPMGEREELLALADALDRECVVRENNRNDYDEGLTDLFRRCEQAMRAHAQCSPIPKSLPLEGFSNYGEYAPVTIGGSFTTRAPEVADAGAGMAFGYVVLNKHGEPTFFTPRDRALADKAFLDYGSRFVTVYASPAADAGIAAPPAASADAVIPSREAIAAQIDPVAFDPISMQDGQHPAWAARRELASRTADKIRALSAPVAGADAGMRELAARLRKAADSDGLQELVMVARRIASEIESAITVLERADGCVVWLRDVGDEDDECWVPCAKGDKGATEFTSTERDTATAAPSSAASHEMSARSAGWIAEKEYNGEADGVRHPTSGDWAEDWSGACAQMEGKQ